MEFLNNVWVALTTQNESLINWLSVPLLFLIEIPLIMYLFISILNITATNKQKILYIVISSIVGLLAGFVIPSPFNVIFNYCSMFVFIKIIFKLNILKTLIAMVAPTIIFALTGTLILNPFINILDISYEQAQSIPIYKLALSFITYAIVFLIYLLLKHRNLKIILLDDLDKKNRMILFFNFAIGLFTIIVQIFLTFYYVNTYPITFAFLNFISLLAYFGISIYSLTRITKLILTKRELESAEAYNKSLSILHDNVRGFKHDFDNIVATIGGYIKTDDMEGLKQYYFQLEDDCQRVNNIATLNPNIINNPGIFNLLSSKYHKADEKNIKINLEFFLDLNTLNVKIYEFSKILGILLDNSIEAAAECEEKIINVKFRNEPRQNRKVIIIENTYNNKDVNTEEIFNKGISGKENHSGLGLWEVRKILKKNTNLNLYTEKNDKFFKQQLEIY